MLLWYWPNRQAAQLFPLGDGLAVGWFLLLLAGFAVALSPSTRITNWWTALLLGAIIASLWYLPRINFLALLMEVDQERAQAGNTLFSAQRYQQYFVYLYRDHLGALAFWLILPAALWPWLRGWWTKQPVQPRATLLWLSLLSAYGCLLLIAQQNQRNLVPLLPAFAVLITLGLQQYPRRIAVVLGSVWIAVLGFQWNLYTFDRFAPLYLQSRPLWAAIMYAMPPASLETDPGYWIAPDVLTHVADSSPEPQTLALLVNMHQIHRGIFKYLNALEQSTVKIKDGTESDSSAWYNLLTSHWVLFKEGSNHNVEAPGQAVLGRIFVNDPLFTTLFMPVKEYPLPNGETVLLYQRVKGTRYPEPMGPLLDKSRALAEWVAASWSEHATLLYSTPDLAYWLSLFDPVARRSRVFDPLTTATQMFDKEQGTLFVVVDHSTAHLLSWLDQHAYRAAEQGDEFAAVAIYGRPQQPLTAQSVAARWGEITLTELRTLPAIHTGEVVPVEVAFTGPFAPNLKLSARLVDEHGAVVASHDRAVEPTVRLGLFVPPSTIPGPLRLVLILYDGVTLAPFRDQQGLTETYLAEIIVGADTVRPPITADGVGKGHTLCAPTFVTGCTKFVHNFQRCERSFNKSCAI
jgi:hypothetical protein